MPNRDQLGRKSKLGRGRRPSTQGWNGIRSRKARWAPRDPRKEVAIKENHGGGGRAATRRPPTRSAGATTRPATSKGRREPARQGGSKIRRYEGIDVGLRDEACPTLRPAPNGESRKRGASVTPWVRASPVRLQVSNRRVGLLPCGKGGARKGEGSGHMRRMAAAPPGPKAAPRADARTKPGCDRRLDHPDEGRLDRNQTRESSNSSA